MMKQSTAINVRITTAPANKQAEYELVQRACHGDGDAFGELYEASFDRIYRYIFFRVTDEHIAEDLSSNVYIKAWESLPRFQSSHSPFIAWLYTIAHNTVIDHYRTTRNHMGLEAARNMPGREPLPEHQAEQRADTEALRGALRHLTPVQQDVVTMKLLDGMTTDEIALQLGKTPGAVRALQMRGLQALARVLQTNSPNDQRVARAYQQLGMNPQG